MFTTLDLDLLNGEIALKNKIVIYTSFLLFLLYSSLSLCEEYRGSGDDVISINYTKKEPIFLLHIIGNKQSDLFSIKGYSDDGSFIGLFVNTIKPYNGTVPVNLGFNTKLSHLEIKSTGFWIINKNHIGTASRIEAPGNIKGFGDDVLWINGKAKIAKISGNQNKDVFSIKTYDSYGNLTKLLVNTSKLYAGKVLVPKNTLLLSVKSTGDWIITIE